MSADLLHYLERPPQQPSSDGTPLLLLLHGFGSNEADLIGLAPYLDPRLHCVSPRAPIDLDFGGYAWYPIDFLADGVECRFEQAPTARDRILQLLDHLEAEHRYSQVFVLGFSQGGGMAFSAGLGRASRLAGIVSLSGLYAPPLAPDAPDVPADFPIFMSHGRQDPVLPVEVGRQAKKLIEKWPVALDYREYDMAHEINADCLKDLQEWLAAQLAT